MSASVKLSQRAFNVNQVSAILGIHRASVYRLLHAGELKVISGFGRNMVSAEEIDRFLGKVEPATVRAYHRKERLSEDPLAEKRRPAGRPRIAKNGGFAGGKLA